VGDFSIPTALLTFFFQIRLFENHLFFERKILATQAFRNQAVAEAGQGGFFESL
jgi:hypothetical protein